MMNNAGMVKIMPAARLSPAEPTVWTMLLSRIVPRFSRVRRTSRDMTAAGIDAEMVIPTFKPTKALAAASNAPMKMPSTIARKENSRIMILSRRSNRRWPDCGPHQRRRHYNAPTPGCPRFQIQG